MCPNKAKNDSEEAAIGAKKGQDIVGICYRCVHALALKNFHEF